MNRIFISYRSSDGKKDAARLVGDLNLRFGDEQVFYDKHDLVGGTSWRDAINATLGTRPVMLVLVTPDLFGATHPEGGRRIDREDDPIRNELLEARQNGAVVVPLLTEGVTMPSAQQLPDALKFFTEAHAQRLRTDDWSADLQRIVADLKTHDIHPAPPLPGPPPRPPEPVTSPVVQRVQKGLMIFGGLMGVLLAIGLMFPDDQPIGEADRPPLHVAAAPSAEPAGPVTAASATNTPADASGIWWSIDENNRRLRVQLTVQAGAIELQTDVFPVSWYPHWQAYAQSVRDMGLIVNEVRYIGLGELTHVMGVPRIEIPVQAVTGDGRGPLDTGSVVLTASADGSELTGQLWSNGEQANTPLRLVRRP